MLDGDLYGIAVEVNPGTLFESSMDLLYDFFFVHHLHLLNSSHFLSNFGKVCARKMSHVADTIVSPFLCGARMINLAFVFLAL